MNPGIATQSDSHVQVDGRPPLETVGDTLTPNPAARPNWPGFTPGAAAGTAVTYPRGVVLADDDPRHGTANGYSNLGCRCDRCRTANAATRRAYLARVRAEGRILGEHGSEVAYDSGCRCTLCRQGHNERWRQRARRSRSGGDQT